MRRAVKVAEKALPPNAQVALRGARLAGKAGKAVRRRWPWFVVAAVLAALLVGAAVDTGHSSVPPSPEHEAQHHRVPAVLWAAYQHSSRVWCHPQTGEVRLAPAEGNQFGHGGSGWQQVDWRLVAAVGKVESGHAAGREVNAFGDVRPWIIGPALDGSAAGYDVVADTDGGRWDLDVGGDRAVGPMQILPETMAGIGLDANGDGMADPHNVWDAAATAARYLCLAGAATDVEQAIFAYNHSDAYVDLVAGEYLALAATADADAAAFLPAGLPLGHGAVDPASPLAAAPPVMASVVSRWAALAGVTGDIEPSCAADKCAWLVDPAPQIISDWQDALGAIGAEGPIVAVGKVLFAGDAARWARLPVLAAGAGLGWPMAVSPPPPAQSPSLAGAVPTQPAAPQWWAHHLDRSDPAWTRPAATTALPAVAGAVVGSPSSGRAAAGDGGCVTVADSGGWEWELCGLDPQAGISGPVVAGQLIGFSSAEVVTVALRLPDGATACPSAVFDHWARGQFWAPAAIDAAYAEDEESEPAESEPSGSEPNPIRECSQ